MDAMPCHLKVNVDFKVKKVRKKEDGERMEENGGG